MADDALTPPCSVERLARETARLLDAASSMDEQAVRLRDPWAEALHDQMKLLHDEAEALKAVAAQQRALSLPGALFQIGLLALAVEEIDDFVAPADGAAAQRHKVRMVRLLYSILSVLRGVAPGAAEGLGLEHFLPARYDVAAVAARMVAEAGR